MTKSPRLYRRKPATVEAMQWDGENHDRIREAWPDIKISGPHAIPEDDFCAIKTVLIMEMTGHVGSVDIGVSDWIVRDVTGRFYPCKNEVFCSGYKPIKITKQCHKNNSINA